MNRTRTTNIRCLPSPLGLAFFFLFFLGLSLFANEAGSMGNPKVSVGGEFNFSKVQNGAVTGAPQGSAAAFHQEIFGKEFTVSVSNLNPGKYTLVIGLVENYFDHAGGRIFDIISGGQTIAHDLDIFAAAGGKGKVFYLTNSIDFAGDAQHSPLTIAFTAKQNTAKLNTFELLDAAGHSLVSTSAAALASTDASDDVATVKVPVVDGPEIWKDPSQPLDARVQDLVRRMSLAEKVVADFGEPARHSTAGHSRLQPPQ